MIFLENKAGITQEEIDSFMISLYPDGYYDYKAGKDYEDKYYKKLSGALRYMKCSKCGAPIQLNQKYCPNCGSLNEEMPNMSQTWKIMTVSLIKQENR